MVLYSTWSVKLLTVAHGQDADMQEARIELRLPVFAVFVERFFVYHLFGAESAYWLGCDEIE
jgi:hypothetical protein